MQNPYFKNTINTKAKTSYNTASNQTGETAALRQRTPQWFKLQWSASSFQR
jgi:hypothetical protein